MNRPQLLAIEMSIFRLFQNFFLVFQFSIRNERSFFFPSKFNVCTEQALKLQLITISFGGSLNLKVVGMQYTEMKDWNEGSLECNILKSIDDKQCVVLLLLYIYLSAAFDAVDHKNLLHRLRSRFGIKGKALSWLQSYLTDRSQ